MIKNKIKIKRNQINKENKEIIKLKKELNLLMKEEIINMANNKMRKLNKYKIFTMKKKRINPTQNNYKIRINNQMINHHH
jgi:hypothetical protein